MGPIVATKITTFFENPENQAVIEELRSCGVAPQTVDIDDAGDALSGLTFVFTGSLSVSRSDAQSYVEQHGANATGSVSGNTDYLVIGDNPGQRKQDDADANDVPIFSEAKFADFLSDHDIAWPPGE